MALKQFSGHTDLNSTRSDRIFREMRLEDNVVRFEPMSGSNPFSVSLTESKVYNVPESLITGYSFLRKCNSGSASA